MEVTAVNSLKRQLLEFSEIAENHKNMTRDSEYGTAAHSHTHSLMYSLTHLLTHSLNQSIKPYCKSLSLLAPSREWQNMAQEVGQKCSPSTLSVDACLHASRSHLQRTPPHSTHQQPGKEARPAKLVPKVEPIGGALW